MRRFKKLISVSLVALCVMAMSIISFASPAQGPQPWGLFGFDGIGKPAVTCPPTECTLISPNAFYLGDSPWTFTGFGFLIVQDAFLIGDQLEVFDNEIPIGITSAPFGSGIFCLDPDVCFGIDNFSKGIFPLSDGPHSFTIQLFASPFSGGAAYLCVSTSDESCSPVPAPAPAPEPDSMLLLGLGLVGGFFWTRRQQLHRCLIRLSINRPRR